MPTKIWVSCYTKKKVSVEFIGFVSILLFKIVFFPQYIILKLIPCFILEVQTDEPVVTHSLIKIIRNTVLDYKETVKMILFNVSVFFFAKGNFVECFNTVP